MKITTETGSYYEIRDFFWSKNGDSNGPLWWAYCFDAWEGMKTYDIPMPYSIDDKTRRLPIQVGKRMYIGNRNDDWISTKIVSIEEDEPGELEALNSRIEGSGDETEN